MSADRADAKSIARTRAQWRACTRQQGRTNLPHGRSLRVRRVQFPDRIGHICKKKERREGSVRIALRRTHRRPAPRPTRRASRNYRRRHYRTRSTGMHGWRRPGRKEWDGSARAEPIHDAPRVQRCEGVFLRSSFSLLAFQLKAEGSRLWRGKRAAVGMGQRRRWTTMALPDSVP